MKKNFFFLIIALSMKLNSAAANDEVYTGDEAAAFLKISPTVVRELFIKKEIPGREVDGGLRFSKQELLLWLKNTSGQEPSGGDSLASQLDKKERSGMTSEQETDIEIIALRDRAALNKSGQISAELGLVYAKQQDYTLTPTYDGLASLEQRGTTSTLTLRYGFGDGYQFGMSVPYQYSSKKILLNGYQMQEDSETQYGPINLIMQKILLKEGSGYPGIICGFGSGIGNRAKVIANCTLAKTYDPAILYASLQYSYPLSKDTSWDLNGQLGVWLKINDVLMLKYALIGQYVGNQDTTFGTVSGRDDFGFSFGLNWRIHKHIYLEPSIDTILTTGGSDFTFGLSLVYQP